MGGRMMVICGLPVELLAAGNLIDRIALRWRADHWPVHAPANAR